MGLESINIHWFKIINSLAGKNPYLDAFMILFAQYMIFIVPIYLIYLFFRKNGEDRKFAVFVFISIVLSLGVSMTISHFYYHPRPFAMGLGTTLISHSTDSSFPSDHTTLIFSFALPFLYLKRYREGAVFLTISVLIGYARIFCGVHFPFDIIGGFLVALAVSYILFLFRTPIFRCVSRMPYLS
ncbi:PAP2 superfamily protein [Aciduliprofundum sp. MAR08-339]|uniref:undecaprenyl-diphosphatase n=1 Tax=Aciduliprofundum sp. (strain MAR08-339) TaxID=673860 RepID=UPI0002A4AB46|nr:PAP2 superfamily protein [Aciduliprofundum sp. MAR08-339]